MSAAQIGWGEHDSTSWLFFWRQSARDGLYGLLGNLLRSGQETSARYVGSQPALVGPAEVGRHATIAAVYERFIAGPFLRESGPGDDVTYFGAWVSFAF